MKRRQLALLVTALALTACDHSMPQTTTPGANTPAPATSSPKKANAFVPLSDADIPNDDFGKQVALGRQIFLNPAHYASAYVGNSLSCESCHLDAGRLAHSAPLWGAYPMYPAYRSKNHHVNTFAERLQGCFQYSMNGKAPPLGDPVLVALETYAYWMAKGAPIGTSLPGRGYPTLPKPAAAPEYARGEAVFKRDCALCHGDNGQGQQAAGRTVSPRSGARNRSTGARAWNRSTMPRVSSKPTCRWDAATP